jgi:hypothetical protein
VATLAGDSLMPLPCIRKVKSRTHLPVAFVSTGKGFVEVYSLPRAKPGFTLAIVASPKLQIEGALRDPGVRYPGFSLRAEALEIPHGLAVARTAHPYHQRKRCRISLCADYASI